jgi:hypothetical protein
MSVYERPGWSHPSPLIDPSQTEQPEILEEVVEEVVEEQIIEEI